MYKEIENIQMERFRRLVKEEHPTWDDIQIEHVATDRFSEWVHRMDDGRRERAKTAYDLWNNV